MPGVLSGRRWIRWAAGLTVLLPGVSWGNSYYLATNGSDSYPGSFSQPFLTAQKGFSVLAPGDELVIRDGTYGGSGNAFTNLPNGNSGAWITIRAENEGGVIVTAGLAMDHTDAYLIFQGLRFQDSFGRSILGNHVKFFRNEFKGGCASGNCAGTSVGTNDFNDTSDVLLEDNWFHGPGGRYNLLIYNSNQVVVRRAVIRHDGGWTDTKGDPEAGLNFYNSSECSAQNSIILDNTLAYHTWQGDFYMVYNSASPNSTINNSYYGNLALNDTGGFGLRFDGNGPLTGHMVQDFIAWGTQGITFCSGACSVGSTMFVRLTIGNKTRVSSTNGMMQWGAGFSADITDVVVTGVDNDFLNLSATYFDTYNNGNTSIGTGRVTYNPFANGLQYLPRIESGSALKTAGSGGGQIGAQIVNRIGSAGTLVGESGWNADTGQPLWPFPNEERIKKEMCTDAGVTRGFCGSASLTEYIWDYLGNGNPYPPAAPAPPARPGRLRLQ